MTVNISSFAARVAGEVADNIEANGHFQGEGDHWTYTNPTAPCCFLANPAHVVTYKESTDDSEARKARAGALIELEVAIQNTFDRNIITVNDTTPTDQFLAMLRRAELTGVVSK